MKVALIGGTGFVGSALLDELLQRGHEVVALARDPKKYAPRAGLTVVQADVQDAQQVRQAVAGCDAVLSGFNAGWGNPDIYADFMNGSHAIQEGTKAAGIKRYIVVGGAGSLYAAPGVQIVDTPEFPAAIRDGARSADRIADPGARPRVDLPEPAHRLSARRPGRAHRKIPRGQGPAADERRPAGQHFGGRSGGGRGR